MKKNRIVLYLFIAILIATDVSVGQKMRPPSDVQLLLDTTQRGQTTTLTINCFFYGAFKDAVITLELYDDKNTVLESTMLWNGKSDVSTKKQFIRSITLQVGSKLRVNVDMDYKTLEGMQYGDGANLYIHHTSKGMLYDESGFYFLRERELWKEAWDKGYKELTIEQIRARDPEMGEKIKEFYDRPVKPGPGSADPTVNQRRLKERELWKEVWNKGYKGLTIKEILKRDPEMGKKIQEFYNLGPGETMPKVGPQKHSSYYEDTTKYSPIHPDTSKYSAPLKEPPNMKQTKPGTQGSDIKPPPRYDTDSLRNKWLKEGRIRRAR